MTDITTLTEQIRLLLIETNDTLSPHEIFNKYINECQELQLSETEFYKSPLKNAHKSIDWVAVENANKQKEETQKKIQAELQEKEEEIKNAPIYIDRLVKIAFDDGIVEGEELKKIFEKAALLQQNLTNLALVINKRLDKDNFKAYPKANFDAATLKETIISTNWYEPKLYASMTAPPPPPPPEPEPLPWKKIIVAAVLILTAGGVIFYFAWYRGYIKDKNATRMYSYVNSLALRSSPAAGANYNEIGNLVYGTEVLVYSVSGEWAEGKANGKRGYVNTKYLLDRKSFEELNSILADADTRDAIGLARYKKALLTYFTTKGIMGKMDEQIQKEIYDSIQHKEVWQVFTKSKNSNPNNVFYQKLISPNSKNPDFACLIKNIATGKRRFLLFSFNDMEEPKVEAEQDAPDNGYIKAITKSYNNGSLQFTVSYAY